MKEKDWFCPIEDWKETPLLSFPIESTGSFFVRVKDTARQHVNRTRKTVDRTTYSVDTSPWTVPDKSVSCLTSRLQNDWKIIGLFTHRQKYFYKKFKYTNSGEL